MSDDREKCVTFWVSAPELKTIDKACDIEAERLGLKLKRAPFIKRLVISESTEIIQAAKDAKLREPVERRRGEASE